MTVEDDTNTYLQLLTPATATSGVLFGDTQSNNVGNISYNHSTNNMNMVSNSITGLTIDNLGKCTANVGLTSSGYTKLGSDAPSVKLKNFTGLMPAIGQTLYVPHGLTQSKIINYACVVTDGGGTIRIPSSATGLDIEYSARIKTDGTIWLTCGNSATLIAGGTYNFMIWYIE